MRILHTESPRIPGEGSSALGKSGPNARPKGVVDGKQVIIPVPVSGASGVTEKASVTLLMDLGPSGIADDQANPVMECNTRRADEILGK